MPKASKEYAAYIRISLKFRQNPQKSPRTQYIFGTRAFFAYFFFSLTAYNKGIPQTILRVHFKGGPFFVLSQTRQAIPDRRYRHPADGQSTPVFPHKDLDDPVGTLKQQLLALDEKTTASLPGKRIGITAGSRGLPHYKEIMKALCDQLKAWGAKPFVFPAMGSHAGATAEGQKPI